MSIILFRVYWNNDAAHDFNIGEDHICSEILIHVTTHKKHPELNHQRFTSQSAHGAAASIREAVNICKRYGLRLQVSNEMTQNAYTTISDVNGWMENALKRWLADDNFTNFFFENIKEDTGKGVCPSQDVTVTIVGPSTIITKDMWCRPLVYNGDRYYSQVSTYSGSPQNNYKWVKVEEVFPYWVDNNKTIKELMSGSVSIPYEFIKGDPPANHCTTKDEIKQGENSMF